MSALIVSGTLTENDGNRAERRENIRLPPAGLLNQYGGGTDDQR